MESNKEFKNSNLERKQIIYPAYQTTRRFHNLYSDVRTFVRELIQNADDADAKSIEFKINLPKQIEVVNDGKPFDSNDIERLLTPCLGGKELDKTGTMNLGALSVLSVSDQPFYHSGNTLLKFEMNHESEDFIPYINENYNLHFNGTRLILPLHSRLSSDDLKKLDNVDEYLTNYSPLLFTRTLKNITLHCSNKTLELKKTIESEELFNNNKKQAIMMNVLVSERFIKGKRVINKECKWFVAKHYLDIPKKYFNQKELMRYPQIINLPIYIAFATENDLLKRVDYPIYIIFPSDTQFGLGFVISSNFKPETSRKGFCTEGLDGKLNKFLLRKVSELIEDVLVYFKKEISPFPLKKRIEFFGSLLETLYYRETYSSLEFYIKEYINNRIVKFLEKNVLDQKGFWNKAAKIALADPGLWPFFKYQYKFIDPPSNNEVIELLKSVGVKELTINELVENISLGKIQHTPDLLNAWIYLSIHQSKITPQMKNKLLSRKSLPNRMGELIIPKFLVIPHQDAIDLYNPQKELNSEFVENKTLKNFISSLGIPNLNHKQVLDYFISRKSSLSIKNLELIKNYYKYFHKFGLLDKSRELIITNQGFKNPCEAFFNRADIKNMIGDKIPLIPKDLESSKKCKMYLENLGVSKELTTTYVINQIKKSGSNIISLAVLQFLSENVRTLNNQDLTYLEQIELIPTTEGKFVRPSDCYFLTDQNKKILGDNIVNFFDPKDQINKDWLKFFKKLGISKYPKIQHLELALAETIKNYKSLEKHNNDSINSVLERIELILNAIIKNDQKSEKREFIQDLTELPFIPTTKGLKRPNEVYLQLEKITELLEDSVPYPLINIPDKLVKKLRINENPIPEDVAIYLLDNLIKDKSLINKNFDKIIIKKKFDKIYSYLGRAENFNRLKIDTIKKLLNKPIVYLPRYHCFEKASKLILYSREAEMIYGDKRNLIKYSEYPNSLNFFKRIGVKTSINTDDIADYLIDYIIQGKIETRRLFMLYHILGQRYKFLRKRQKLRLKKAKIILCDDLTSFEYVDKIFIPDEKSYIEKFPSIKVSVINDKIIDFLEKIGVKKVSEVVIKKIMFSGEIKGSQYSNTLSMKVEELIPFIETIVNESNVSLDKNWKIRVKRINYLICEHIFHELQYKNKKSRIQGKTVEYDSNKNIIGIIKDIYKKNPTKFLIDFSKAIAYCLFIGSVPKAKLISPLIEKLLNSENKIQTLKELGYSTFKLEVKKLKVPKVKLNLTEITKSEYDAPNLKNDTFLYQDLPKISKTQKLEPYSWTPKKFNIIKDDGVIENQKKFIKISRNQLISREEQVNIIIKSPPSQNKMASFINQQIEENFNFNHKKISNYYKIDRSIKKMLNGKRKTLYKSMQFPGRAEFGGLDIIPPIPKLLIENHNGFQYYIQENLKINVDTEILRKFKKMLQFITTMMGGNPDTVSIALFNAPIEAFNYQGQMLFNYLLMVDEDLEAEYPLFLIWLMIVAHELSHNLISSHNQLHSKYMMIFTLNALKNLESIKEKYNSLFSNN